MSTQLLVSRVLVGIFPVPMLRPNLMKMQSMPRRLGLQLLSITTFIPTGSSHCRTKGLSASPPFHLHLHLSKVDLARAPEEREGEEDVGPEAAGGERQLQ